jgi:hypothetical protein
METRLRSERGMALIMAVSAIVVLGVLIAGMFFLATQDYRIAANTGREARAVTAAELGLNRAINEWNPSLNLTMVTNDTVKRTYSMGGGTVNVLVTRLPGLFFWATSESQSGGWGSQASARRRYGSLWRLDLPEMNFLGAVVTSGQLIVSGNATVSGNDNNPSGWTCTGKTNNVAGVAMGDLSKLNTKGACATKGCITGSPNYLQTTQAADTNTYFNYGGSTYQTLAASATKVFSAGATLTGIGPVVSGGVCQTSNQLNWGDPNRASPAGKCETYYPIIHGLGDMRITTGSGQGILLVDGNLDMAGNFTFNGVIIARGTVTSSGTGAHITGGIMAATVALDSSSTIIGNSAIQYSSCAIQTVNSATSYPKQAIQRGWVDLR